MGKLTANDIVNSGGAPDTLPDGATKVNLNNALLESTTAAEGAAIIGVETIAGLTGNDVQTILEALLTRIESIEAEIITDPG